MHVALNVEKFESLLQRVYVHRITKSAPSRPLVHSCVKCVVLYVPMDLVVVLYIISYTSSIQN